MKSLKQVLFTAAFILLLGACSSEKDSFDGFDYSGKSTVIFSSNIEGYTTRVSGNEWNIGDAVGLYAIEPGQELAEAAVYNGKENIKYTTAAGAEGKFVAAIQTEAIQLEGNKKIDVIGYYPYVSNISNYKYPINVKDQSNWAKIDLLYSDNAKNVGLGANNRLVFKHQLARVILQVEPGNGIASLTGLKGEKLENVKAEGLMDLKNGVVTLAENAQNATIVPKTTTANSNVIIEALLVPSQNLNSAKLTMVLNGQEFIWEPKNDIILESGKKYTYRLQLASDGTVIILNPSGTIEDWVEGNPNDDIEVITPEEGGTETNDKVSVDSTTMQFVADGEVKDLNIKASSQELSWSLVTSDAWITVDKAEGKGSGVVKVTVSKNATTTNRTGTLTLKSEKQNDINISITQAGENTSQPGKEVEFFVETFEKVTGGTKLENFEAEYKNYVDNPNATYSVSYSNGMLRSTSKIDGHIWFGAKYENWFKMSDVEIDGYNNLKIKFSLVANQPNAANANMISVKVDGNLLKALPSETLAGASDYKEYELAIPQPASNKITVEFIADLKTSSQGVRLDNIKIIGSK